MTDKEVSGAKTITGADATITDKEASFAKMTITGAELANKEEKKKHM